MNNEKHLVTNLNSIAVYFTIGMYFSLFSKITQRFTAKNANASGNPIFCY